MGMELARAASQRGASVTLILGDTKLKAPLHVNCIKVVSALEMFNAVKTEYKNYDIIIKAAAVADYRPKYPASEKIKKTDTDGTVHNNLNLEIGRAHV